MQKEVKANSIEIIEFQGDSRVFKGHNSMMDNVLKILNEKPICCKNDSLLYFEYLKLIGQIDMKVVGSEILISIQKSDINKLKKPESVSRCRRELHKLGLINYDRETEDRRAKSEKAYHSHYQRDHSSDFESKANVGIF